MDTLCSLGAKRNGDERDESGDGRAVALESTDTPKMKTLLDYVELSDFASLAMCGIKIMWFSA